jgi:hypothetical protein
MIQVLGFRRVAILTALLLANAVLAAMVYYVLIPQKDKTENELRTVKGVIDSRRNEIATLKTQYELIQEQKNLFGNLEKAKFFTTQDRVEARKMMEAIQSTSRVLSAKYSIGAAEVIEDPVAAVADHVILHSPISVSIDALDDVDIYSFIYWMENAFPGYAGVSGLTMERKLDIDEAALRQIGNGVPTVLMNARVDFDWDTMVPRSQLPQQLGQPASPQ